MECAIIHQAFESLKPFIFPQEPITVDNRIIYSYFNATLVENEEELRQEIENKLNEKKPNIEITWTKRREVVLK